VRLGPYELPSNLFLSPLAGYTNLPMRLTVRELGGLAWTTTDLVNARSLLERSAAALRLVASSPQDQPFAIQLFGSVPEEMRDAAMLCQELGADSVDINMGCPVRKVTKIGGGSAMMTELARTAALVRGMVAAVKIPVTAKMRLGWDDDNLTAPDLARVLEDAGVAAVFVHGRTRAQGFFRPGEPRGHPRRRGGGAAHPGDRQRRRDDPRSGPPHAPGDRLRRREHRARGVL
jgi:tRNA-dihydrouridine synthase B